MTDPKHSLIDVLIRNAMNWINCECAMKIASNGKSGLTRRIETTEAEINHLRVIIEDSDIKTLVKQSRIALASKTAELDEMFRLWHASNDVTNEHKKIYNNCIDFCRRRLKRGYSTHLVLFNAVLLQMDPTNAEPFQRLAMPYAAKLIRKIRRASWISEPWATPAKPAMPDIRRVSNDHRVLFIPTVLAPDEEILMKLQFDYDSPELSAIVAQFPKSRRKK